ncbi:MAG TPA: AraC family ligand binding domain-containing protein [Pyrinomonadaceae bacterium]|nr:AraC family ligand binding domain-containing protein [Pyrinomonadaceae bacterium]
MSRYRYRVRFHPKALTDMVIADGYARDREVGHFFLAEATYPPNFHVPRHAHENTSLYLVLGGSVGERKGNRVVEHPPGTVVFTPQDEPHSNYMSGADGKCFLIDIKRQWLESVREPSLRLDQSAHFDGGLPVALVQRVHREVCRPDSLIPMVSSGRAVSTHLWLLGRGLYPPTAH